MKSGDGRLLQSFLVQGDEAAFAEIVQRHLVMVRTVCRRWLRDTHDVDDAVQNVFVVLARNAASIHKRDDLRHWLFGVAHRTAMKAKCNAMRRQVRERQASPAVEMMSASCEAAYSEWQRIVDEEVSRLPHNHRAAFTLCAIQGRTKADAASVLGWNEGTLASRLAQARARLRQRLTHRGITLRDR